MDSILVEITGGLSAFDIIEKNGVLRGSSKNSEIVCERNKDQENVSIDSNVNFETPNEHLVEKIIQQVEYLFSDVNILKDKFLLKHMRRNKEGYVSLKLISSLRKVKALSKDWRVVAYSLRKSKKLQMNDEMTKIKRICPLPQHEVMDASRTVLVFHYLPSCLSIENVKKQLRILGTVVMLEIFNSKTDIMNTDIKKTLALHENIATFPFAVVKFETADEAANAVLHTSNPLSIILKIVPLVEDGVAKCTVTSPVDTNECLFKNREAPIAFNKDSSSRYKTCSANSNTFEIHSTASKNFALFTQNESLYQSQKEILFQGYAKDKSRLSCFFKGDGPINNQGIGRKRCFKNSKQSQVVIIRQPRGPDGTIGFKKWRKSVI